MRKTPRRRKTRKERFLWDDELFDEMTLAEGNQDVAASPKAASVRTPDTNSSKKADGSGRNRGRKAPGGTGGQPKTTAGKSAAEKAAAAKSSADGGKLKKGAPKSNKMLLLQTGMDQLKLADSTDSKYYGAEWNTSTRRNWDEYLPD